MTEKMPAPAWFDALHRELLARSDGHYAGESRFARIALLEQRRHDAALYRQAQRTGENRDKTPPPTRG